MTKPPDVGASRGLLVEAHGVTALGAVAGVATQMGNAAVVGSVLGVVEGDSPQAVATDGEGNVKVNEKDILVTWVPDELLARMDEQDREGYKRVEGRFSENRSGCNHHHVG